MKEPDRNVDGYHAKLLRQKNSGQAFSFENLEPGTVNGYKYKGMGFAKSI